MDDATGWALRARDGDSVAESAFIRATQADVWRFCASLVDAEAADDLTQEAYLRAFRALPSFAGRSSVRTWLLGIARRTCADHVRAAVRRRRLDEALRFHSDERVSPDPAAEATARDLLAGIANERRSAFVLTQVLGLAYDEAAAVEGVPVGTIRSRVARARDDLIAMFADAAAS